MRVITECGNYLLALGVLLGSSTLAIDLIQWLAH
jgi:hypothetical protein